MAPSSFACQAKKKPRPRVRGRGKTGVVAVLCDSPAAHAKLNDVTET
jgi:hypothetical protein